MHCLYLFFIYPFTLLLYRIVTLILQDNCVVAVVVRKIMSWLNTSIKTGEWKADIFWLFKKKNNSSLLCKNPWVFTLQWWKIAMLVAEQRENNRVHCLTSIVCHVIVLRGAGVESPVCSNSRETGVIPNKTLQNYFQHKYLYQ